MAKMIGTIAACVDTARARGQKCNKKAPCFQGAINVVLSRLRLGKAQQQVTIVGVLLLTQFDFAWQAFGDGVG